MEFLEALLNVLAIIGIIVAAAFIVFFLGDLLLSVLEPRHKKEETEQPRQLTNDYSQNKEVNYSTYEDYSKTKSNENEMGTITEFVPEPEKVTSYNNAEPSTVDYEEALNEKRRLGFFDEPTFIAKEPEVRQEPAAKDDDLDNLFNDEDFNFSDDFDFNFGDEETKEEIATINEHIVETEKLAEPIVVQATEVNATQQAQTSSVIRETRNASETYDFIQISQDADAGKIGLLANDTTFIKANAKMEEEIAKLREELENQRKEYERLRQQAVFNQEKLENEKNQLEQLYSAAEDEIQKEKEEPNAPLLSIEEYEARLEVLRVRLKANEKELKETKREFLPLRKVRKTLDGDKKKLRRREALVAKQKVVLYGVNNIMEIDEEKAKKLAEDLDLLDGLKVSVQHCEEVMDANKERYPILETTYRILSSVNQDIKDDIAECEKNIEKLKAETGDADDGAILEAKAIVNGTKKFAEKTATANNAEKKINISTKSKESKTEFDNKAESFKETVEVGVEKPAQKNKVAEGQNTSPAAQLIEATAITNKDNLNTNLFANEELDFPKQTNKNDNTLSANEKPAEFEVSDFENLNAQNKDFDEAFLNQQNQQGGILDDFDLDVFNAQDENPYNFEETYKTFAEYQKKLSDEPQETATMPLKSKSEIKAENKAEVKAEKSKLAKNKKVSEPKKDDSQRRRGRPRRDGASDIDDIL